MARSRYPFPVLLGLLLFAAIGVPAFAQSSGSPSSVYRDQACSKAMRVYDANGSVSSITDQQENLTSRVLGYDGLDRLTSASGIWGAGVYGYDGLDNLRSSTVGGRTLTHSYDASNRLVSLSGSQSLSYGYDARGNLTSRGAQAYSFDIANRLLSAPGKASYGYDGHGRRTWVSYADGSWNVQFYSLSGELLFTKHSSQGETRHIGLGRRLLAEQNSASGLRYAHTDALGSPVAWTNASGQLITRTRYEPYGGTAAGTNPTGIGYTGHVNDADTGLVYMQQRYYDPLAGRFLSVDPVVIDSNTGGNFNRYAYGNANPYGFRDPDGRESVGEFIDRKATEAAGAGNTAKTYGWAFAGVAWKAFGAEGLSQVADKRADATGGDRMAAGIEIAAVVLGPLGKPIAGASKVELVIAETLAGKGGFTSTSKLSSTELHQAGEKFVGSGAKEIGKPGSGVFRSADGTRQFRIDNGSLTGSHSPGVPHGHLETYAPGAARPTANNHIPFYD